MILRTTFRSLSVLELSQPSRALTVTPGGNWKYLVFRYFENHLEGDATSGGALIALSDAFAPIKMTLVPCAPISSAFTSSSSGREYEYVPSSSSHWRSPYSSVSGVFSRAIM